MKMSQMSWNAISITINLEFSLLLRRKLVVFQSVIILIILY